MAEQQSAGFHLALGPGSNVAQQPETQQLQQQQQQQQPHLRQQPQQQLPFGLQQTQLPFQMMPVQQMAPMQANVAPVGFAGFPNGAIAAPQFPAAPGQPAAPQALMGVLNLLQQNIGALQALVPLLATQGGLEQPQQQQQPQQQPQLQQPQQQMPSNAVAPGIVSAISQLATATASLLPQLSAAGQAAAQQQQQSAGQAVAMQGHEGLALSTPGPAKEAYRSPSSQQQPRSTNGLTMTFEPMGHTHSLTHTPSLKGEERDMSSPIDGDDDDDASPGNADEEPIAVRNMDIVEMDPVEILAEHTHFCEICGKGFKRDANLRMHMRGHGDEYKTASALARPDKHLLNNIDAAGDLRVKRFSCPYVGCKRNKQHKRFTPLKTMLCVKNHYRRSHCPKMLTCSKCGSKRFSVVADLRTHEKHCGKDRWLCSCGTTFSRKDKLLGHLALFLGHTSAVCLDGGSSLKEEDASPSSPADKKLPAALSTSGGGICGKRVARDCVSSTLNLNNNPNQDDADCVEREVVVYKEQPLSLEHQRMGNGQGVVRQRPPVFNANFLT